MFRYVALSWNADSESECAAARQLSERLQARAKPWSQVGIKSGLCVLHTNSRQGSLGACSLTRDSGVLLGAAFHRNPACTDDAPSARFIPNDQQCEHIIASRGRWLIEHVWGNYVAIGRDPDAHSSWVLKDPCGSLPCFITHFRGVRVIFAHVADLLATGLCELTLNSQYLANRVLHGGVLDAEPLHEVQRIHRGEWVDLRSDVRPKQRLFLWHPLRFTGSDDLLEEPTQAAQAIRATVRSCTHTLAREHPSVLHRLSGGLDSSIVAACLSNAPDKSDVCCYTYYAPGGRSDERPWARLAAGRCGLEHEQHAVTAESIPLPSLLDAPALVEPTAILGYLHRSTLEHRIACEHHATAVFCGDGGDSGFCGDTFAYAVSEYLRRHPFGTRVFRLAANVAALSDESSWTVMFKSLRRWIRGAGMEHQLKALLPASQLLSQELRDSYSSAKSFPHPWLADVHPIPWALVRRLGALLASPEFYNVADGVRAPEVIAPLYSQPATELFLRIPVDVHFHGGVERGLARLAFAQDVPAEILRRTWKDRAPGFLDHLVQRHRKFLREVLLDGVLMQAGLLNRAAVEDALSDRISASPVFPAELLRHLEVEVWARQWRRSGVASGSRVSA